LGGESWFESPLKREVVMDDVKAYLRETVNQRWAYWQEVLGCEFFGMIISRRKAMSYTTDPDPRFREAAFFLLHTLWKPRQKSEVLLAKAALDDPSPQVRATALFWLAVRYVDTQDPNASKITAWIVLDKTAPLNLRITAYLFFCLIQRIKVPDKEITAIERATSDLPSELDMTPVRQVAGKPS
jgi:hypothetical protein